MEIEERKELVRVARGQQEAGLVLKDANVFLGFTGEFRRGDIAIEQGRIAGFGSYHGAKELDMSGKFIVPGFIDAHVHIESSMLSPAGFADAVVPAGTTTVVTDPHEIANVAGAAGIKYMLDASADLPLAVYVMLPSCVPATPLEDSGAVLLAESLQPFLQHPRVLGLAEFMNVPGVLQGDAAVFDKLQMADGCLVDGHAPGLTGQNLMAYAAAGVASDHECITAAEGRARLAAGMYLLIREGSAAHNMKALLPLVDEHTAPFICLATDDRQPADLIAEGDINHLVKQAISGGVPVETALQMASINAARYFGLRDVGAIAPGFQADLAVFDDLSSWRPSAVFKNGRLVAENGKIKKSSRPVPVPDSICHTMHVAPISPDQLRVAVPSGRANIIGLVPEQIVTKKLQLPVKTIDGAAVPDPAHDILKLAVFERHHATGKHSAALVQGFGLQHGAVGATVSHDSHNLILLGTNDDDMLAVAEELIRIGGGVAVADGGKTIGSLPLPIGGLMSNRAAVDTARVLADLKQQAYALGIHSCYDPFLTLAFLSLPVIPALKLTDEGLVDVEAFSFLEVDAGK